MALRVSQGEAPWGIIFATYKELHAKSLLNTWRNIVDHLLSHDPSGCLHASRIASMLAPHLRECGCTREMVLEQCLKQPACRGSWRAHMLLAGCIAFLAAGHQIPRSVQGPMSEHWERLIDRHMCTVEVMHFMSWEEEVLIQAGKTGILFAEPELENAYNRHLWELS